MLGRHSSAELHPKTKDLILDSAQIPTTDSSILIKCVRAGTIRFRDFGGMPPFSRGLIFWSSLN